ncbi:MAG: hypothetical protein BJ554DRAFT_32 [Olpidium bornovanus]|uniref:Sorting nexin/Vps5-like C-terminal domain-containing protein n=1 Tax=Olpidium bornovanus TaxID=278681 RepID=A0A8H7ZUI9_9FUNG|nr:MAG: hypothetical protein BJ554DRAFT_32 [Olpidium bornovanus]
MSNAAGGFVKFNENDEVRSAKVKWIVARGARIILIVMNPFAGGGGKWFDSKRSQLDVLESQLKALHKTIEGLVKQRKGPRISRNARTVGV